MPEMHTLIHAQYEFQQYYLAMVENGKYQNEKYKSWSVDWRPSLIHFDFYSFIFINFPSDIDTVNLTEFNEYNEYKSNKVKVKRSRCAMEKSVCKIGEKNIEVYGHALFVWNRNVQIRRSSRSEQ